MLYAVIFKKDNLYFSDFGVKESYLIVSSINRKKASRKDDTRSLTVAKIFKRKCVWLFIILCIFILILIPNLHMRIIKLKSINFISSFNEIVFFDISEWICRYIDDTENKSDSVNISIFMSY